MRFYSNCSDLIKKRTEKKRAEVRGLEGQAFPQSIQYLLFLVLFSFALWLIMKPTKIWIYSFHFKTKLNLLHFRVIWEVILGPRPEQFKSIGARKKVDNPITKGVSSMPVLHQRYWRKGWIGNSSRTMDNVMVHCILEVWAIFISRYIVVIYCLICEFYRLSGLEKYSF